MARKPKPSTSLTSRTADVHELYEIAVQRPEIIVGFIDDIFDDLCQVPGAGAKLPGAKLPGAKLPGAKLPGVKLPGAGVLREDFCGTANLASMWVRSAPDRRAVGVDNDKKIISWADRHNRKPLGEDAKRLSLVHSDVMDIHAPRADVLTSLNFSHFIYKTRDDLLSYLRHARRSLKKSGLLVLDAFGGPGSITPCCDKRKFSEFDYIWEQESFDPLTNEIICHIHFRFKNGSTIKKAFTYNWRMWSLIELQELISQAGFDDICVYFESEDGFISDVNDVNLEAWVAYVVAVKTPGS